MQAACQFFLSNATLNDLCARQNGAKEMQRPLFSNHGRCMSSHGICHHQRGWTWRWIPFRTRAPSHTWYLHRIWALPLQQTPSDMRETAPLQGMPRNINSCVGDLLERQINSRNRLNPGISVTDMINLGIFMKLGAQIISLEVHRSGASTFILHYEELITMHLILPGIKHAKLPPLDMTRHFTIPTHTLITFIDLQNLLMKTHGY